MAAEKIKEELARKSELAKGDNIMNKRRFYRKKRIYIHLPYLENEHGNLISLKSKAVC